MTRGPRRRGKKSQASTAFPRKAAAPRPGARPVRSTRKAGQFRNLRSLTALGAAVAAAAALVIVVAVVQGGGGGNDAQFTIDGPIPPPTATANGTTLGSADAPITIYEYSDFQCPFFRARAALNVVPPLDADYLATGKAKLIFKVMSFIGQESRWAGEAALCAGDQGKFWEYHNKLFDAAAGR